MAGGENHIVFLRFNPVRPGIAMAGLTRFRWLKSCRQVAVESGREALEHRQERRCS